MFLSVFVNSIWHAHYAKAQNCPLPRVVQRERQRERESPVDRAEGPIQSEPGEIPVSHRKRVDNGNGDGDDGSADEAEDAADLVLNLCGKIEPKRRK